MGKQRENWRTLTDKGIALLQQNQPQQALVQLRRARRQAPRERSVRYWLGNAHRVAGAFDKAYSIFSKLLAERPGDFDTSFEIGRAHV